MRISKTKDQKLIDVLKAILGPGKMRSHAPLTPKRREKLRQMIQEFLNVLTPREEKVLRMRFGIGEKSDHTLEKVGQDFGVTRERIRQLEYRALRKLRRVGHSRQSHTLNAR